MANSIPTSANAILLQNYVDKDVDFSNSPSATFTLKRIPIPSPLPEDSILVRTLYLSNDPIQRVWIQKNSKMEIHLAALPLGQPMGSYSLSRVVQVGGSGDDKFKVGDLVEGPTQWADYAVVNKTKVRVIKTIPGVGISAYLGALGVSGETVYFAFEEVLKPKKTDTLIISGAAGAVGNVAIQYAKKVLEVKRVIGIAGSDEKCNWLKSIGADAAVNYKSATFSKDLAAAAPDGIDKFFDSVGGPILDETILHMNPHGVICVVGAMNSYNNPNGGLVLNNYMTLLMRRLSLTAYTLADYYDRIEEADEKLALAVTSGKLKVDGAEMIVDVEGKLEEIPRIWNWLFEGKNTGKLITKVSSE